MKKQTSNANEYLVGGQNFYSNSQLHEETNLKPKTIF